MNLMMRRALAVAAMLLVPTWLSAQQTRVTGQVTAEETGQPLAGVQIVVKGTTVGTLTDGNGNYAIRIPAGSNTLVFSYLGYQTAEHGIEDAVINVALARQAIGLEGITVTAMGIRREKRSLGYSVQDMTAEQVNEVPELNVVTSLQGRVAGVHITDAGPTGGSARIVIRGASSIAGNNQPLFVVDGVPIDNSAPRNFGFGGIDYGNTAQDIDPNNIESISVLKGPNAAALYGSRAANGAIVITTKSGQGAGSGGLGITASTSFTAETPLRLPNYQDVYGQGLFGEFEFVDGEGGGTWDFVDESWGPKMECQPINQFTGPNEPFCPHPDNVRSFFETGTTWNTNVAVGRTNEDSHVRLSLSNTQVAGMMPGNTIDRYGVALRGGASLTDRLSTEVSINYMRQEAVNRPGTGYDEDNPLQSFIWFGRQVDMDALRNYRCTGNEPTPCIEGTGQYNWNYNYHNNPYWEQLVNTNGDERDRVIGHIQTSYQVNDWITLNGQIGQDWWWDHRKNVIAFNSLDDDGDGHFNESNRYNSELNADLMATATRQLTPAFGLTVTAGTGYRENNFDRHSVSVAGLTVPGIYTIDNASKTPIPTDYESKKVVRRVFGSASLNYNNYLNVDVTASNDWSSTLPEENRSYFYPSISAALVFTDALGLESDLLSSGKVRASWTRVGNDTDPYQLTSTFAAQTGWGGVPMFAVPNQLANANLKPEEKTGVEFGADLGFFNERLGFVVTYYDETTENQILGVDISATSGYTSQSLNAGAVRNYGTELLLNATPLRGDRFRWDVTLNWAKNNSQVRELYGDLETLVLGDYWSLNIEARAPREDENGNIVEYYPYGVMFGNPYLREDLDGDGCGDAEGRLLLSSSGRIQRDPCRQVLGQYTPDWTGGIQNRFSYGPFDLSVLVDGQKGGDIFSVTNWFGEYAGVLESTLRGRENDICDPGIVVDGLLPDGTENTQAVCPQTYFGDNFGKHEASIDDASYIKLREVRLGYRLPSSLMGRLGFSGGTLALIGRNLALWSNIDNIDPETAFDASNVQGIEFGQFPTARSLGFTLSIQP